MPEPSPLPMPVAARVPVPGLTAAPWSQEIHLRRTHQPPGATSSVVFLHGLDGHFWNTWGPEATPGAFPLRLADDLPQTTIALFDYPAHLPRFIQEETLTLQALAQAWAHHLNHDLFPHVQRLAIIGYCLGGLITTLALRHLQTEAKLPCLPLDVFLLDVPHRWPPGHLAFGKVFQIEEPELQANATFWHHQLAAGSALRPHILTSQRDSWVAPMNPTAGLSNDKVVSVDLAHDQLVRVPAEGAHPTYDHIVQRLRAAGFGRSRRPE